MFYAGPWCICNKTFLEHLDSNLYSGSYTVDPRFNRPCLLVDNQPRSGLKSVSVKESPVGASHVGNIIRSNLGWNAQVLGNEI